MPIQPSDDEDRYFQELEGHQREKQRMELEARARALEERERTARAAGTTDLSLAQRIEALGLDGEAARLLDLLPLVFVAWADGTVSAKERLTVMRSVEARGIGPQSPAFSLIVSMLERRPAAHVQEEIQSILKELVRSDDNRGKEIVDLCLEVAEASRALFGLGSKLDPRERGALQEIAEGFSPAARAEMIKKLS